MLFWELGPEFEILGPENDYFCVCYIRLETVSTVSKDPNTWKDKMFQFFFMIDRLIDR